MVRELILSNCGVGDKGCELLASLFAGGNTTIAGVNLEKNLISAAGASAVAVALRDTGHATGLREINFSNQVPSRRKLSAKKNYKRFHKTAMPDLPESENGAPGQKSMLEIRDRLSPVPSHRPEHSQHNSPLGPRSAWFGV